MLLVLWMIAIVTVALTHAWFVSSSMYDVAMQREVWYKKLYTTELVLNAACKLVEPHFDALKKRVGTGKVIPLDVSSVVQQKDRVGALLQKPHGEKFDGLMMTAWYQHDDASTYRIRCLLEKKMVLINGKPQLRLVVAGVTFGVGV